jgi:hypothetical protein
MSVSLTVSDLFTPALSGVGPFGQVPPGVAPAGTWLAVMLNIAATVQLPTTAWQPGGPERTILAIEAVSFSQSDADISVMAQGSFLTSAATGTVTYTTPSGTVVTIQVTPDPSNPSQNPTGALGWLDLTTQNVYDVTRLSATYASGLLAFANLSGGTVNYVAGAYHAANTATGTTYTNPSALAIPSSAIAGSGGTVVLVAAVGLASTLIATQTAHGLAAGSVAYLNIPPSAGVSGLADVFAVVTAATPTTFQAQVPSGGFFAGSVANGVYACTLGTMTADVLGNGSNAAPGQVTTALTQNANVYISNAVAWSGSNWESNGALVTRTLASLAQASPNGPSQAFVYFAETAPQILAAQTPPYNMTNGNITAASFAQPATGLVVTVCASASPVSSVLGANVTPGCAQLGISGVSNANPCVVTCAGPHGLLPVGTSAAIIQGVLGTAGVNGSWNATYLSPTTFSIPLNTTAAGAYTSGGTVEGGDLGEIDNLLQLNCTPDGDVTVAQSALALPVVISASISVPAAEVATYALAAPIQLQVQISAYPIGGTSGVNAVEYDDIVGALEEAGVVALGQASYVKAITALSVTVGGVACPAGGSVPFPSQQYQAILVTPSLSIVGT